MAQPARGHQDAQQHPVPSRRPCRLSPGSCLANVSIARCTARHAVVSHADPPTIDCA